MVAVTGDPAGVRSMSQSLGSTAAATHSQGAGFAQACSTIVPVAFAGPAGDRMRSNVSQLQAASAALAQAYDRVASFLPRVADAIEKAQAAEKVEQKAAQALSQAEQVLVQAQARLAAANGAVAFGPPLSLTVPTGPTPAQLAAQAAAQQAVQQAQHQVDQARQALRIAQFDLDEAEGHRRSVMADLQRLCWTEAQIAERSLPAPTSPVFGPFGPLSPLVAGPDAWSALYGNVTSLLEIPTIAGSPKGAPLLGYLMAAIHAHNAGAIQALDGYVTQPVPRPQPVHHGGGGFFSDLFHGHIGRAVGDAGGAVNDATAWAWHGVKTYGPWVALGAGTLATGGLLGYGMIAADGVATAVGAGGLIGGGTSAVTQAIHGGRFSPLKAVYGEATGAALPGAGAGVANLTKDASGLIQAGGTLLTGAGGSAAANAGGQLAFNHRISDWGSIGGSAALGWLGSSVPSIRYEEGLAPGASIDPLVTGSKPVWRMGNGALIGHKAYGSVPGNIAIGAHQAGTGSPPTPSASQPPAAPCPP